MIELELNESNELKFSLSVSGVIEPVNEVRFTLNKGKKKLSYPCVLENEIVTVVLDDLKLFGPGEHKYDLEVFIGNQYYNPLSDVLKIKQGPKVESKVISSKKETHLTEVLSKPIEVKKVEVKAKKEDTKEIKEDTKPKKKSRMKKVFGA